MTTATHISLPSPLLAAYRAAGGPPLSSLCADAVRAWLEAHGHEAPPVETPHPQTGKATAARAEQRRGDVLSWVRDPAGQNGERVSACGTYVVWVQERGPRTDAGVGYAASLVVERYAVAGRAPRWLCTSGTLGEAKRACERHAKLA